MSEMGLMHRLNYSDMTEWSAVLGASRRVCFFEWRSKSLISRMAAGRAGASVVD